MKVTCDQAHAEVEVSPEEFATLEGVRRSWQCPLCRMSFVAKPALQERVLGPLERAGVAEVSLSLLVKAGARIGHGA